MPPAPASPPLSVPAVRPGSAPARSRLDRAWQAFRVTRSHADWQPVMAIGVPSLRRFLRCFVRDAHAVDDLGQLTMLWVWEYQDTIPTLTVSYLTRHARNRHIDATRKLHDERLLGDQIPHFFRTETTHKHLEAAQLLAEFQRTVPLLSGKYRRVMKHLLAGAAPAAIARRLRAKERTVRSWIWRGSHLAIWTSLRARLQALGAE